MGVKATEVCVVGGGLVGLATAAALCREASVVVVEAEEAVARHQSGHNSGVIHSGLYYKPGSLKAKLCVRGREMLYRFCAEHGVSHEQCGKLVVAVQPRELAALAELERRGRANGLSGLRRLDAAAIRDYEPYARGVAALYVSDTGIVDYPAVAEALRRQIQDAGGEVRTATRLRAATATPQEVVAETDAGSLRVALLVNCAGLYADRVARACGVDPGVQIVPFRGEYYRLVPSAEKLCRHLIYPVPDPRLPFLGVHFTRMIRGGVECGPNAVLALSRCGYRFRDVCWPDVWEMLRYPGFWHLSRRFWRTGLAELHRSLSRRAFWRAARRLVPAVRPEDLTPAGAGVRAQAVDPQGRLVDDFVIRRGPRMVHVVNAPSPAATACLAIGEAIAAIAREMLGRPAATATPLGL